MTALSPDKIRRRQQNYDVLNEILVRASRPGFWGKVTLQFEDGELRPHFSIESTLRASNKMKEDINEILDATMGSVEE